jgi:hypothetical protein
MHRHTYPQDGQEEEVRQGFDPDQPEAHNPEQAHNLDAPFAVGDNEDEGNEDRKPPVSDEAMQWESRDYSQGKDDEERTSPQYGSFREERNVWGNNE